MSKDRVSHKFVGIFSNILLSATSAFDLNSLTMTTVCLYLTGPQLTVAQQQPVYTQNVQLLVPGWKAK